jgi:hypothetical protein
LNLGSSTSIDKSTKKSTFRNMSQPNSPPSLLPPRSSNSQLPNFKLGAVQNGRSIDWKLKIRILESYLHIHMTKKKPTLHNNHSFWLIVSISSAQLSLHKSCTNHTLDPPAATIYLLLVQVPNLSVTCNNTTNQAIITVNSCPRLFIYLLRKSK